MTSKRKGLAVGVWLLLVLCATVWAEFDSRLDKHWDLWKKTHQKKYQTELEEMGRRAMWEKNLNQVNQHNLEVSLGLHTYTLGINHLSDLTEEETLKMFAPLKLPEDFDMIPTELNVSEKSLPASVDWRDYGIVTSVKNQGKCESCYAFSAAGALEGLWALKTGTLVDLSPQNLVDCSKPYGNNGCNRGFMHKAFEYVIKNNGIDSEASYPYQGKEGPCSYNPKYRAATCSSFKHVPKNEASLKQAVANVGPISVAVDSRHMLQYSSGVFSSSKCGKQPDHAVLLIGYGTDPSTGLDYWLIKNSWGPGWGENGYIRLARNKNQMCAISAYAVYPE